MSRGLFITFEGSEGCGKSTQIRRLAARLEKLALPFIVTREPGGTPIGEEIRHLLQFSKANAAMTAEAELLLFTASRAQLVRELIEPALAEGRIVIADRFCDSTTVYQGVARRLDVETVAYINQFAVGSCRPDLTFVLDLDLTIARDRVGQRRGDDAAPDRMEQQTSDFYAAVRAGYLKLAASEPARFRVIDASHLPEIVEAAIWQSLEPAIENAALAVKS